MRDSFSSRDGYVDILKNDVETYDNEYIDHIPKEPKVNELKVRSFWEIILHRTKKGDNNK